MSRSNDAPTIPSIARGLRFIGAALILVGGGVHLYLWHQSYRSVAIIGPLFLLNAVAAALIALALIWKPEGIAALLGLGLSAATLGAFVLAATVGLFGFTTGWDGQAVLAACAEAGAIMVLGTWWMVTTRKRGAAPMGERAEDPADADVGRARSA
jgi:hypothetical protein